jgi:outer membrane protein assembly factor BamE
LHGLLLSLGLVLTAGCSGYGFPGVYRINVEQGNIVTLEMLDQLKPGMTTRQVRYILGTPLIEDPFHPDRWEYLYMIRNGNDTLAETRLTVFFEDDKLTHFSSSVPPSGQQEAAEGAAEADSDAA